MDKFWDERCGICTRIEAWLKCCIYCGLIYRRFALWTFCFQLLEKSIQFQFSSRWKRFFRFKHLPLFLMLFLTEFNYLLFCALVLATYSSSDSEVCDLRFCLFDFTVLIAMDFYCGFVASNMPQTPLHHYAVEKHQKRLCYNKQQRPNSVRQNLRSSFFRFCSAVLVTGVRTLPSVGIFFG